MTAPTPSGGTSPLRVGGLALLGVGAVAGLIGLATLVNGNSSTTAAATTSATSTLVSSVPPSATAVTPSAVLATSAVTVPSLGATPTNGITLVPTPAPGAVAGAGGAGTAGAGGAGGAGTAGAGGAGAGSAGAGGAGAGSAGAGGSGASSGSGGHAVVRAAVRVYNNSTITGLAARAADQFRNAGWPVEQVANYPSGIIPTSTVYYRPGTSEQSSAQSLASQFGMRAAPRFEGLNDASPGLIVIVTNDYQKRG